MQQRLKDKVVFITGASRGIGREIALHCSREGATVVIAAKTTTPHPKLDGTIYTVQEEIEKAGGRAMAIPLDVRDETNVESAINATVEKLGGIDILINNASAINLDSTESMAMKRYDLIMSVNVRATYMCSKFALPHLKKSQNPHILNLSPPMKMDPKWFKDHLAYTISKYGMSMCTFGMAEEFKEFHIAVNSLWPRTLIATAAVEVNFPPLYNASRKPSIVADAAIEILSSKSTELTGNFFIDEDFLRTRGVNEFEKYSLKLGSTLYPDFYVD